MHGRLRGGLKLLPEQLIGRHLEVCIYRRNYPADNSAQISFPPLRYLSSKQASLPWPVQRKHSLGAVHGKTRPEEGKTAFGQMHSPLAPPCSWKELPRL